MAKYSFNQDRTGVVFASLGDVNASFKDLGAVCAAIRYKSVPTAMELLTDFKEMRRPVEYHRHNRHMGARRELGGRKGRWPRKCAALVEKALANASANATNKGYAPESMYVVHAAANKTIIARRGPPKGALFVTGGPIGYVASRHSDLEFSRIEIGISELDEKRLSTNAIALIKRNVKAAQRAQKSAKKPTADKVQPKAKRSIITKVAHETGTQEEKKPPSQPAQLKEAQAPAATAAKSEEKKDNGAKA